MKIMRIGWVQWTRMQILSGLWPWTVWDALTCILNNALMCILTNAYLQICIITLFLMSKTGIIMCTLNNDAYWWICIILENTDYYVPFPVNKHYNG